MRAIIIHEYEPGKKLGGKRVVALGFFDGVHLGHREILKRAVSEANRLSLPSAVFTFLSESDGFKGEKRIYSTKEKLELIAECGIDEAVLTDFNTVKSVLAKDFIEKILIEDLGCSAALSGEDFRFGKGACGDTALLKDGLERLGSELICPAQVMADGEKISSSCIKTLLLGGKVEKAGQLLGAPYFVKSKVVRGLGLGRSFGFPTVNTEIDKSSVALLSGVYKCESVINGRGYDAISNVGTCPTVSDREKHIETYIIGYNGDLYGQEIIIKFLDYIREEKKFESENQLKMQIKADINSYFEHKEC